MTVLQIPRRVYVFLLAALLGATVATQTSNVSAVGANELTCQGFSATIVGTAGADRLVGTQGPDVILALGGSDVIVGRGGNDIICAGWGDDRVTAGDGADRVYGGPGADHLTGGANDDQLFGGKGSDILIGNGGNDLLSGGNRRDSLMGGLGNDTLNGGFGPDRIVGGAGIDTLNGGAGIDTCAFDDAHVSCEKATLATRAGGSDIEVDRVIHISIDGLRSDYITRWLMPNVTKLQATGASTLNARTDPHSTKTLPNHTSQFTGRPFRGTQGHGVEFNEDNGQTVHSEAGEYVASVFDVAHDNGLTTAMYVGKEKFEFHRRTWNANFARPDLTGRNDGRDKIDVFVRDDPATAAQALISDLDRTNLGRDNAYIFFHIRLPDSAGHQSGWGSKPYGDAVAESDRIVGQLVDHIEGNSRWNDTTGFIITSDHGGPQGEFFHDAPFNVGTFTIPFMVNAPGVLAGADLYALNRGARVDPGDTRLDLGGAQPIRGHEAGNLALDLLGLPPIPGSVFNAGQDLRLN